MAHRTARLNSFGRQLLVDRVMREGWSVATAAEAQGVSRATGHKWVRRYRLEGPAGLLDRSSRPHRSPPPRRPGGRPDPRGAARMALGTRPPRAAPRPPGLDRRRRPASQRAAPPARHRPADRPARPALRGLPPGRARPPGPQEARPDPRRRRPSGARSLDRDPQAAGRSGTTTSRSSSTTAADGPSSCRCPTRRQPVRPSRSSCRDRFAAEGITVERVLTDNGGAYRSQRLSGGPGRSPPQPDPTLSAADQRQGRAVHPDPPPRVGVRAAVPLERRTPRTPCRASSTSTISAARTPRSVASHPGRRQQRPW